MTNEDIRTGVVVSKGNKKGYGFIKNVDVKDAKDIFFHAKGVVDPEFEKLEIGDHVNYIISTCENGIKAIGITKIYK